MAFYDYGSFVQELLKWLIFGIKAAHVLDSGTTSSGSITTMKILSYQLASELISVLQMTMFMYLQRILEELVRQEELKKMEQHP